MVDHRKRSFNGINSNGKDMIEAIEHDVLLLTN